MRSLRGEGICRHRDAVLAESGLRCAPPRCRGWARQGRVEGRGARGGVYGRVGAGCWSSLVREGEGGADRRKEAMVMGLRVRRGRGRLAPETPAGSQTGVSGREGGGRSHGPAPVLIQGGSEGRVGKGRHHQRHGGGEDRRGDETTPIGRI